jgi:hypothetical protein
MPSSHIPRYLVGFTLATAGQDKENLGADEAEVIAVSWAVVDTHEPKVRSLPRFFFLFSLTASRCSWWRCTIVSCSRTT